MYNEMLQDALNALPSLLMQYVPGLVLAIVVLIVGLFLIKWITNLTGQSLEKRKVDPSLIPFLKSILKVTLTILLLISVASMVGIQTTSFIAVVGAAGLALGLALQGSLANFAGGVLILLLKPYQIGDYISAQGQSGTVEEIQIFYTVIYTPQNQKIVIPNGGIANNPVTNYSAEDTRRLDFAVGIAYSDDIDQAKSVLKEVFENDERVMREPEPEYLVEGLGDHSVNLKVRAWTSTDVFWPLYFDVHENVKKAFDRNGITIPFPQREVHWHNNSS